MHPRVLLAAAALSAGSIAYVDHDRVFLTAPDGSRHVRVTRADGYSFASQADDGTIVALRRQRLERMDRRGRLRNAPVPLWLGAGTGMFTGPYYPQVSPDGRLVAYGFGHQETVCDGTGCSGSVQLGTAYTRVDRYTEPQALGKHPRLDAPVVAGVRRHAPVLARLGLHQRLDPERDPTPPGPVRRG